MGMHPLIDHGKHPKYGVNKLRLCELAMRCHEEEQRIIEQEQRGEIFRVRHTTKSMDEPRLSRPKHHVGSGRIPKRIEVDGVEYESAAAAAKAMNVTSQYLRCAANPPRPSRGRVIKWVA